MRRQLWYLSVTPITCDDHSKLEDRWGTMMTETWTSDLLTRDTLVEIQCLELSGGCAVYFLSLCSVARESKVAAVVEKKIAHRVLVENRWRMFWWGARFSAPRIPDFILVDIDNCIRRRAL